MTTTTNTSGDGRVREIRLRVQPADLTAAALNQTWEADDAFPADSHLAGAWWELGVVAAQSVVAEGAMLSGGAGPTYALSPGQTLEMALDGGGPLTATWDAAAGYDQTKAETFDMREGDVFDVVVTTPAGAQPPETVTIHAADVVDLHAITAAELAAIVAAATGPLVVASVDVADVRIATAGAGTGFSIAISGMVPAAAGAATIAGGAGPTYNLAAGDTLIAAINGGAPATATWDAAAAYLASGAEPWNLNGLTVTIQYEDGAVQAVDLSGVANPLAVTRDELRDAINLLPGGSAVNAAAGAITVRSDKKGTASRVRCAGTGAAVIFADVDENGTGDVADIDAVTISEIEAVIEADIAGTAVDPAAPLSISTTLTGATRTIQITGGTGRAALGLALTTVYGWDSVATALTLDGPTAGTGDVVDISAVTKAEVETVVEFDCFGVEVDTGLALLRLRTTGVGSGKSLEVTGGTARVALGFALALDQGIDDSNTTATVDMGYGAAPDSDLLTDGDSVFTGATTGHRYGAGANAIPTAPVPLGGQRLRIRVDSDGNVNLLTGLDVTAVARYTVSAP